MSSAQDRIAQFRKMTTDDPENELGHFRLGQLLMEDGQYAEAIGSLETTLKLSPEFSKAFQLLGESHAKNGDPAKAINVLLAGWEVADKRGDKMPRDAMGKALLALGGTLPESTATTPEDDGPETGFKCARPLCTFGKRAKPLGEAPMAGEVGERIYQTVCIGCWDAWKKDFSIKVINELRLDLSSESGAAEYDRHMLEFMGFDEQPTP
jgi:Fe-S cluster biosynthesis and repair protein YggX